MTESRHNPLSSDIAQGATYIARSKSYKLHANSIAPDLGLLPPAVAIMATDIMFS